MTTNKSKNNNNTIAWILYGFLVVVRLFVCPCLPGYIHPDEFFQGGQELWFGCSANNKPWEFAPNHALRSIVPPTIMTRIPLMLYGYMTRRRLELLNGREVWIVPRFWCALLVLLILDGTVWKLSSNRGSLPTTLLLLSTCWPTLVMMNRPFTNTLETLWLSLLLWQSRSENSSTRTKTRQVVFMGMACAVGIFTRFTFVCFAFPVMLQYLLDETIQLNSATNKNGSSFIKTCHRLIFRTLLPLGIGFSMTAIVLIYADYSYYQGSLSPHSSVSWTAFVTPLNAFVYNSQVDNLRHHGLHPRWTHALVNMHLLFGPLTILSYIAIARMLLQYVKTRKTTVQGLDDEATTRRTCAGIVLVGLTLLSSAPHQEARFLLPLLVPMVLLTQPYFVSRQHNNNKIRWLFWVVWIVFNSILFVLYGILHQGGIVPSLIHHNQFSMNDMSHPKATIYHHTYMPPTFLSRQPQERDSETCAARLDKPVNVGESSDECHSDATFQQVCLEQPIVDLQGASIETLQSSLDQYLDCNAAPTSDTRSTDDHVLLVSPPLLDGNSQFVISPTRCHVGPNFDCHVSMTHYGHLTTEDSPPFQGRSLSDWIKDFNLSVYKISCHT